ncbi:RnfG Predicted NADH,ubiquinone oxidoreductase, subunit RnfG [Methylophilaceae bacterium]|jgi:electron transport complex protein RnfG
MRLPEIKSALFRNALRTAAIMLAFAFIGTLLLASVFDVTRAPIEASEKAARLSLFKEILPAENYDNDLLASQVTIAPNALLGNRLPSIANVAKQQQQTAGVILEAIAHDGYSGDIKLLIAIRADGSISGVRVLAHKETPGLGDYIDIAHGNWIKLFDNESLEKTAAEQWQVKKDGGQYDYMVGATITPRAVVKAVKQALQFYQQNKQTLFAVNP